MTLHLVSRHPGAVEWMRRRCSGADTQVHAHLASFVAKPGDEVWGVLPLMWAARLCAQGVRVFALDVDLPLASRGRELCADELLQLGARLHEYRVERLPSTR